MDWRRKSLIGTLINCHVHNFATFKCKQPWVVSHINIYTVIWTEFGIVTFHNTVYQLLKVCSRPINKFVALGHSFVDRTVVHFQQLLNPTLYIEELEWITNETLHWSQSYIKTYWENFSIISTDLCISHPTDRQRGDGHNQVWGSYYYVTIFEPAQFLARFSCYLKRYRQTWLSFKFLKFSREILDLLILELMTMFFFLNCMRNPPIIVYTKPPVFLI